MINADKRLIVALDFHTMAKVSQMVHALSDSVNFYKIGMELFYSVGPEVVSYLRDKEKSVFLDLKLHDIPNTVAKSAAMLTKLGISMMTVHASGGYEMIKAAAESVTDTAATMNIKKPKLIAVTVLTSISPAEYKRLGYTKSITEQAVELALLAKEAGADGVVASGQEAEHIKAACGEGFDIVVPGVRPSGAVNDDQSRVVTPKQAFQLGATHIVVGRPITLAHDVQQACNNILMEMNQ